MNSYFDEPPSYNTCMQIPESEPDYSKRPVLVGTTTNHCDEVIPISSHFPIPSAPSVTVLLPTVTEDRPEGWFKMIYLFCYFKILNLLNSEVFNGFYLSLEIKSIKIFGLKLLSSELMKIKIILVIR